MKKAVILTLLTLLLLALRLHGRAEEALLFSNAVPTETFPAETVLPETAAAPTPVTPAPPRRMSISPGV